MAKVSSRKGNIQGLMVPLETSTLSPEDRDCTICQEAFQGPGRVTRSQAGRECAIELPCGHIFGENCIMRWLEESDTCPQCRRLFILEASKSLARPIGHQRRFHEVAFPLRNLSIHEESTDRTVHLSAGDLPHAPEIPTLMEWVNTIDDSTELMNLYLSIVTMTNPVRFTTATHEGRQQLLIAIESLRHLRLFYHIRLFYLDVERGSSY